MWQWVSKSETSSSNSVVARIGRLSAGNGVFAGQLRALATAQAGSGPGVRAHHAGGSQGRARPRSATLPQGSLQAIDEAVVDQSVAASMEKDARISVGRTSIVLSDVKSC